jgi:DNA mismatch endonuclease, patch repair protein
MARITGANTGPEKAIERCLTGEDMTFERHAKDLPGRPDFVFRALQVAVFVDGDFWHGFRFPLWRHKLAAPWRTKIDATRSRDARNFARLRRLGWRVLRIWEHQIEMDTSACIDRIRAALAERR